MRMHEGYVAYWHEAEMPKYLGHVRCWKNSGKHMLALSFSGFDPTRTSRVAAHAAVPPARKMPLEAIWALLQLPLTASDKVVGSSLSQRLVSLTVRRAL
jgi:hypothetical protein